MAGNSTRPSFQVLEPTDGSVLEQFIDLNTSQLAGNYNQNICLLSQLDDPCAAEQELNEPAEQLDCIQDECMNVYLRVRPLRNTETDDGCLVLDDQIQNKVAMVAPSTSKMFKSNSHWTAKQEQEFTFTRVFPGSTTQQEFYDATSASVVNDILKGEDALMFTYGVTASGKTYTLLGAKEHPGILPRTLASIFKTLGPLVSDSLEIKPRFYQGVCRLSDSEQAKEQELKDSVLCMYATSIDTSDVSVHMTTSFSSLNESKKSVISEPRSSGLEYTTIHDQSEMLDSSCPVPSNDTTVQYSLWVSFIELYNEKVYDLLCDPPKRPNDPRTALHFGEDANGVVYVKGLREISVKNADEAMRLLYIGRRNLHVSSTRLNYSSSRSHCVYSIRILQLVQKDGKPAVQRMNRFWLCDLAGAERTKRTENTGDRLKETSAINTSLLILGNCIRALRSKQNPSRDQRPTVVPFRESRLTRLCSRFFQGFGKTCMLVCASPASESFDETVTALRLSSIASTIITRRPEPVVEIRIASVLSTIKKRPANPRTTIEWDVNAKRSVSFDTHHRTSVLSDLDLTTADEETEVDAELITEYENQIEEYKSLLNELRCLYEEECRKNFDLEHQVRQAVCAEFGKLMEEKDRAHRERLDDLKYDHVEEVDTRIALFVNSAMSQKQSERRVTLGAGTAEHDDWIPKDVLDGKMKEYEQQLSALRNELEQLKSSPHKQDVDDSMNEATPVAPIVVKRYEEQVELIEQFKMQLTSANGEIERLESEKKDIEAMLVEAGETYEVNRKEQEELTARISSLETTNADMIQQVKEKDDKIQQLQIECDKIQSDQGNQINDAIQKQLTGLQVELSARDAVIEDLKRGRSNDVDTSKDYIEDVSSVEKMEVDSSTTVACKSGAQAGEPSSSGSGDDVNQLQLIEYESKMFDLEKERDRLRESVDAQTKNLDDLKSEKTTLALQVANLDKEVQEKSKQIELSTGQYLTKIRNLEHELTTVQKERDELKHRLENSKKDRRKAEDGLSALETKFAQKNTELTEMEVRLSERAKDIDEFAKLIEEMKTEMVGVEEAFNNEKAAHEVTKTKLNDEKAEFEKSKVEMDDKLTELANTSLALAETENKDEVNQLKTEMSALESQRDQLIQERISDSNQVKLMRDRAEAAEANLVELNVRLESFTSQNISLESTQQQLRDTQSELQIGQERETMLQQNLERARAQNVEWKTKQEELVALFQSNAEELQKKSHLLETMDNELNVRGAKLEESNTKCVLFQQENVKLMKALEEMQVRLRSLEQSDFMLSQQEKNLVSYKQMNEALTNQLSSLRNDVTRLQNENKRVLDESARAQATCASQATVNNLQVTIQSRENDVTKMNADIESWRARCNELMAKVKEHELDVQRRADVDKQLQQQILAKNGEIDMLRERLNSLTAPDHEQDRPDEGQSLDGDHETVDLSVVTPEVDMSRSKSRTGVRSAASSKRGRGGTKGRPPAARGKVSHPIDEVEMVGHGQDAVENMTNTNVKMVSTKVVGRPPKSTTKRSKLSDISSASEGLFRPSSSTDNRGAMSGAEAGSDSEPSPTPSKRSPKRTNTRRVLRTPAAHKRDRSMLTDHISPPSDLTLSGRPQRLAKQTASDGIAATYYSWSLNNVGTVAKTAADYIMTGSPLLRADESDDNESTSRSTSTRKKSKAPKASTSVDTGTTSRVPPKKRQRRLYNESVGPEGIVFTPESVEKIKRDPVEKAIRSLPRATGGRRGRKKKE